MKLKYAFIIFGITLVAQSCTKVIIDTTEAPYLTVAPSEVNYADHIEPIINNYCSNCHIGSAPADGIDLSTYESTKEYSDSGNLISRLNDTSNPMPPSGMLSVSDRALFDHWKDNNFPEN